MGQVTSDGAIVAPATRDLQVLAGQLVDWLQMRLPSAKALKVTNLSYPRGAGQSHETILFDAAWRIDDTDVRRGLVVRIKPTSFTVFDDDMFFEQHRLMSVLHESGAVRVAETLWLESDPAVLGSPFFVMEKLHGRVPVSIPSYMEHGFVVEATVAQRRTLWTNGVRELARVANVPLDLVDFLAVPGFASGFDMEWDRWSRFFGRLDRQLELPWFRELFTLLGQTKPANRPAGLTWGDARIGNMLIDDDFDVIALMDWEQPSLGGALQDLGWWVFNLRMKVFERGGTVLPGIADRADTIGMWADLTGISTDDIDWYEAFAGFKMACTGVNLRAMRGQDTSVDALGRIPHLHQSAHILGLAFHE